MCRTPSLNERIFAHVAQYSVSLPQPANDTLVGLKEFEKGTKLGIMIIKDDEVVIDAGERLRKIDWSLGAR